MLQPHNGIFICTWYDDPNDTALFALTPLLDELITSRAKVPEILEKYRDQIPTWAGFDQYSQLGADYSVSEYESPQDFATVPSNTEREQDCGPEWDAQQDGGLGPAASSSYIGGYEQPPPGVYMPPWPAQWRGQQPQQPQQQPPPQQQQQQQPVPAQQPVQEMQKPSRAQAQPARQPERASRQGDAVPLRSAAPFSASGISGPYQASPPARQMHAPTRAGSGIGR